jgi:arginine/lysine/ornithine decarboxylase
MNLYERLIQYNNEGYYPMHMPGHKRNRELCDFENPFSIDITEIEGFDNLHQAQGILAEGMERCKNLYGSNHTHYLVGGSSSGILTGISACTKKGDKVLVARNSHKSVYNALYLKELDPVYIYPGIIPEFNINGSISSLEVEQNLIKNPDIKLVIITSPTYEGVMSDVKAIAEVTHKYGIPLLVDEAHGAHLGFHEDFPKSSVCLGADIVIHSIHKTLLAFTQTALIHINGNIVNYSEIKRYLSIYQSTSPSYILMAGIEQCTNLLENRGRELFCNFSDQLEKFYKRAKNLKHLRVLTRQTVIDGGGYDFDPSKIVISGKFTNYAGKDLYDSLLDRYKIQMEMVSMEYVLGMTSIADTVEGFLRLIEALEEIDNNSKINHNTAKQMIYKNTIVPEVLMPCHKAYEAITEVIPLSTSGERIAGEYLYLYPPGIPLLVPGERIQPKHLEQILKLQEAGLVLQGMEDLESNKIKVIR